MTNNNDPNCPSCGAPIPEEAPGGLCPGCALEVAASVSANPTRSTSTPPPTVGEIAPHFLELEILELLGAGGMGAVYKARQPKLDRFVALKILSHDLAGDPAFVERFNREGKLLARLSHPNIVGVHDFGSAGPYCYLVMEFIDGVNLRQAMQAGKFTPRSGCLNQRCLVRPPLGTRRDGKRPRLGGGVLQGFGERGTVRGAQALAGR